MPLVQYLKSDVLFEDVVIIGKSLQLKIVHRNFQSLVEPRVAVLNRSRIRHHAYSQARDSEISAVTFLSS
jgi:hypothetical protein